MTKTPKEMAEDVASTPFIRDLEKFTNFNGNPMPIGYYNLVVSIRDFKLYDKGMKPHRHWKPTFAREYFGLKPRLSTKETITILEDWRDSLNAE
jgi:hypothetical protein